MIPPTIKDYLNYDPASGEFIWIKTRGKGFKGDIAGTLNSNGYLRISFSGKRYYAHQLALWWVSGVFPKEVDHLDRDKLNNRINNLREVTRTLNSLNKVVQSNNKSTGVLGVTIHKHKSGNISYRVQFRGKHVGLYSTLLEAESSYNKTKEQYLNDYRSKDC